MVAAVAVTVAVRPGARIAAAALPGSGARLLWVNCPGVALIGHSGLRLCPSRAGGLLLVRVAEGWDGVAGSGGPGDGAGWRVFVSHTSELREFPAAGSYVAAVERAISACGHVIVDMADFPAADQVPAELCRERVRGCQVYVGVLGTRYGSPVRDKPEVSYTELEFDTATEAGLPRLVFLLDTERRGRRDPAVEADRCRVRGPAGAFRRRVQDSGLVTQAFTDPATLGQLVERSLRELAERRRRGDSGAGQGGQVPAVVVAGEIPQEPLGFQPRPDLLAALDAPGPGRGCGWCMR